LAQGGQNAEHGIDLIRLRIKRHFVHLQQSTGGISDHRIKSASFLAVNHFLLFLLMANGNMPMPTHTTISETQ